MSRPSRNQEDLNEVVEDSLLFAADTEAVLLKFAATIEILLAEVRNHKRSQAVKGQRIGFKHARPELLDQVS